MARAKQTAKKEIRGQITATLESTFENLRSGLSDKKFKRNIKKASKILTVGLKTKPEKKAAVKKITTKKSRRKEQQQVQEPGQATES